MADNGGMNRDQKDFLVDSGIKVGLTIFAVVMVRRALSRNFWTDPGRVDRLHFDLEKTQNRYIPLGNDEWEVIPDPWSPADLARRAHTVMNGLTFDSGGHVQIYDEIRQLGLDRARWLHNYWLDEIDPKDTIYRWIDGEKPFGMDEVMAKARVMAHLNSWGAGF